MHSEINVRSNQTNKAILFRIFLESNFFLSLGFIISLVLQTLWFFPDSLTFSFQNTPILFRNVIISLFSVSTACFALYFAGFYLFILYYHLSFKVYIKKILWILISAIITIIFTQLSVLKVLIQPDPLINIAPKKMFIYFFPTLVLFAFIGITVASTFFLDFRIKLNTPKKPYVGNSNQSVKK